VSGDVAQSPPLTSVALPLTPDQVRSAVTTTASSLKTLAGGDVGAGLVNLEGALNAPGVTTSARQAHRNAVSQMSR